jgi:hypothetical protein
MTPISSTVALNDMLMVLCGKFLLAAIQLEAISDFSNTSRQQLNQQKVLRTVFSLDKRNEK